MIKITVDETQFTSTLLADEYAGWSYGATKALYEYYQQLSEDIGEDIELDRVAIRCEWNEYDSAVSVLEDHTGKPMKIDILEEMTEEDIEEAKENTARFWLEERTQVLDVYNTEYDKHGNAHDVKSVLVLQF
jgi:hypothetical protein